MGRGTANIGQDHFRRIVLREHDVPGGDNVDLIAQTARHCLNIGYHVIVEGILFSQHYGPMLREMMAGHVGPHHVFYLDVPLEVTLRRHVSRPLGAEVAADTLRAWYVSSDALGVADEVVLDGTADPESVMRAVQKHIGPVTPRADQAEARFL